MKSDTKLFTDCLLNSSSNAEEQSVQSLYSLLTEHMQNSWSGRPVDL